MKIPKKVLCGLFFLAFACQKKEMSPNILPVPPKKDSTEVVPNPPIADSTKVVSPKPTLPDTTKVVVKPPKPDTLTSYQKDSLASCLCDVNGNLQWQKTDLKPEYIFYLKYGEKQEMRYKGNKYFFKIKEILDERIMPANACAYTCFYDWEKVAGFVDVLFSKNGSPDSLIHFRAVTCNSRDQNIAFSNFWLSGVVSPIKTLDKLSWDTKKYKYSICIDAENKIKLGLMELTPYPEDYMEGRLWQPIKLEEYQLKLVLKYNP